ncbi:Uncharacterized protein TCM_024327 [Theobroma cacao]|uniref:Uncharacterized protein n=1 Tax=Theobroma cacao TaxID=3641 RepID=A0A061F387_THECC|nr:Uncharacterized protein TCM_024327 [Theobroma cacao]
MVVAGNRRYWGHRNSIIVGGTLSTTEPIEKSKGERIPLIGFSNPPPLPCRSSLILHLSPPPFFLPMLGALCRLLLQASIFLLAADRFCFKVCLLWVVM